jgi:hypothetical protein
VLLNFDFTDKDKNNPLQSVFLFKSKNNVVSIIMSSFNIGTTLFFDWYNEYRPHTTLNDKTPNEIYYHRHAANAKPRIET